MTSKNIFCLSVTEGAFLCRFVKLSQLRTVCISNPLRLLDWLFPDCSGRDSGKVISIVRIMGTCTHLLSVWLLGHSVLLLCPIMGDNAFTIHLIPQERKKYQYPPFYTDSKRITSKLLTRIIKHKDKGRERGMEDDMEGPLVQIACKVSCSVSLTCMFCCSLHISLGQ